MEQAELYTVLGVSRSASAEEIKQAYRRLARRLHPDRNADDPCAAESFLLVTYAYGVLSDPRKRRRYDRMGEVGRREPPREGPPGDARSRAEPRAPAHEAQDAARVPGQPTREEARGARFTGKSGGKRRFSLRRRGADLVCEVVLELWEAVRGCERELRVKVRRSASPRLVRVRIPPGAQRGDRLKVRGLGREGSRGGEPGDLWLDVRVRDHEHFFLEGGELHAHLPITPLEAYAGVTVPVPTPLGSVHVRVPPRSQPGMKLRIRGHGVRRGGAPPGDLILHLRVVLPTRDGLAALYQPLDEALGVGVRRGLRFE